MTQQLSEANEALLVAEFGTFWPTVFYYAGSEVRAALNRLLDAARAEERDAAEARGREKDQQEIARLQEIVRRYGDRIGMANAPPHLQITIDDAMGPNALPTQPQKAQGEASEPVAWRRHDLEEGWLFYHTEGDAKGGCDNPTNDPQPLYTRPEPHSAGKEVREAASKALRILRNGELHEITRVVDAQDVLAAALAQPSAGGE